MLSQRETRTIGVLTPQALSVIFSNPFFGAFSEGVAFAAEAHGYALYFISPLHGSLAGAMGRATVDGVVAIGCQRRPSGGRADPARRRADRPRRLERPARPRLDRRSTTQGGARAAAEHLIGLGHRDVLIVGVEPPAPVDRHRPESVSGRRLRGYREAFEAVGVDHPGRARSSSARPASRAAIAALETAWRATGAARPPSWP